MLESQGPPVLVCSVVQVQEWLRVLEPGWLGDRVQKYLGAVELAAFLRLPPGGGPPPLLVVRFQLGLVLRSWWVLLLG